MNDQIILFADALNPQQNCIDYAVAIARKFNSQLLLYSVQYTPVPWYPEATLMAASGSVMPPEAQIVATGRNALESLCDLVKKQWGNTVCEFETGFMAESIVEKTRWLSKKASELEPMMLIMGKEHDYYWWNRMMGTSETHVAEEAACPVLLIPPETQYSDINQVTYLLDDDELADGQMADLQWLISFCEVMKAALSIYYLPEKVNISEDEMDLAMSSIQELAPYQNQSYKQFPVGSTVEDIMQFALASPTGMLAFPFRKKPFFQHLFGEEDARELILKATLPVLVF
jgi:hypothetical protein